MLLGQVLERLHDETFAAETLVGLSDLALLMRVEQARCASDEDLGEYSAGASRRFCALANDEDWLALMAAIERAPDAGAACLKHMLEWSLRRDASCEGGCS